jgi:diketogulonate reductase-like aldo/keto reductase
MQATSSSAIATRVFGPTRREVPVVGLGTANISAVPRETAVELLRAAIDMGPTHIDTAEMYGDGQSERLVGEAIEGRRNNVFLATKVHPDNATLNGTITACENSLRRLRTDHVDLYLLHWRGDHPLAATLEAFRRLEENGKIRAYGVSNFDVADLDEAVRIAGTRNIVCNQIMYNLVARGAEDEVMPWCDRNGVIVVGYSPFGSGTDLPPVDAPQWKPLRDIAATRNVSPQQIMLAFLVRSPRAFTIVESHNMAHVRANIAAAHLTLSVSEIAAIEKAFPRL